MDVFRLEKERDCSLYMKACLAAAFRCRSDKLSCMAVAGQSGPTVLV